MYVYMFHPYILLYVLPDRIGKGLQIQWDIETTVALSLSPSLSLSLSLSLSPPLARNAPS